MLASARISEVSVGCARDHCAAAGREASPPQATRRPLLAHRQGMSSRPAGNGCRDRSSNLSPRDSPRGSADIPSRPGDTGHHPGCQRNVRRSPCMLGEACVRARGLRLRSAGWPSMSRRLSCCAPPIWQASTAFAQRTRLAIANRRSIGARRRPIKAWRLQEAPPLSALMLIDPSKAAPRIECPPCLVIGRGCSGVVGRISEVSQLCFDVPEVDAIACAGQRADELPLELHVSNVSNIRHRNLPVWSPYGCERRIRTVRY